MSRKLTILLLTVLSSALLSVPFLVPGTGWLSLIAFVPLLWAEDIATGDEMKGFCWWHYLCFVLWNAATTFWVCNATVGWRNIRHPCQRLPDVAHLRAVPLEQEMAKRGASLHILSFRMDRVGTVVPHRRADQLALARAWQRLRAHDRVDPDGMNIPGRSAARFLSGRRTSVCSAFWNLSQADVG